MKRMTSQEIYTKKKGGQFLNELASGDVFFSFHFNDNCLGVFIAKGEVTTSNLEKIYKGIFEYTGNTKNIEIKIIANLRLIDKVSAFFDTKGLTQIKKIEKKEKTETNLTTKRECWRHCDSRRSGDRRRAGGASTRT